MRVEYRRAAGAVWRHGHGGVLVLVEPGRDVVVLSGGAADVWSALAEPRTVDDIGRTLATTYTRLADEMTADVAPLVDDLVERGVVDRVTTP